MAAEPPLIASAMASAKPMSAITRTPEKRYRSIFDVPPDFFDSCSLLSPSTASLTEAVDKSENRTLDELPEQKDGDEEESSNGAAVAITRWTCNTCKAEFESLHDQRSHFKSDIHRINVKLSIAGKSIVNEDDFDEFTSDGLRDWDISSISGSEDEDDRGSLPQFSVSRGLTGAVKQKLFFRLGSGEKISLWKSLLLSESESISYGNDKAASFIPHCLQESEVIQRLKFLTSEPRDKRHFRIMLLASGGHFAGCVFDGSSVVVHKTFHRYVVRAKAGKKQSSKDGAGRAAHSAGASLRRHNELALKKDIQELLTAWKPYFDACSCVFIHAPSSNHQLLFDGDKAYFSSQHSVIRNIPMSVRRPTLKEARRIYSQLTQFAYEMDVNVVPLGTTGDIVASSTAITNDISGDNVEDLEDRASDRDTAAASSSAKNDSDLLTSTVSESEDVGRTTPLHEAAQAGDPDKIFELLEQGLDPCLKDERGRTPYTVANEKEARNSFRRFMALNLDRWDWHAARVPSPLTKEMEESQAAKQAEKDAKKKARAKELKKLRKAKEKKAQAEASTNAAAAAVVQSLPVASSVNKGGSRLSKEEELRRAQVAEREKRAAAAERRMAAAATTADSSTSQPKVGLAIATDLNCSCCNASLSCLVPFHRYNYKYCSSSCMHVHREILEDG